MSNIPTISQEPTIKGIIASLLDQFDDFLWVEVLEGAGQFIQLVAAHFFVIKSTVVQEEVFDGRFHLFILPTILGIFRTNLLCAVEDL